MRIFITFKKALMTIGSQVRMKFSDVFMGSRNVALERNGLSSFCEYWRIPASINHLLRKQIIV